MQINRQRGFDVSWPRTYSRVRFGLLDRCFARGTADGARLLAPGSASDTTVRSDNMFCAADF
jgi:hypothetical protein